MFLPDTTKGAPRAPRVRADALERLVASLLRLASGKATAKRALCHALRLYGTPRPDNSKNRKRFLLRSLWYRTSTAQWFAWIAADTFRRHYIHRAPYIAEKPHRPYQRADLLAPQRVTALQNHLELCAEAGFNPVLRTMLDAPIVLATLTGKDGRTLILKLEPPGQFEKEGDCAIHLEQDGFRACTVAFSFRRTPDNRREAFLGCLQGPTVEQAKDLMREITKATHGLRPKALMVDAVRAVAQVAGCTQLVGIGGINHIYRNPRKRKNIAFDYDEFWQSVGGVARPDGDFDIPVAHTPKALEDVPSKKRAEVTRRNALIAAMHASITHALGTAMAPAGTCSAPPPGNQ